MAGGGKACFRSRESQSMKSITATIILGKFGPVHEASDRYFGVLAANSNFAPAPDSGRRLTLEESLARTKIRFAKTLAYLSDR